MTAFPLSTPAKPVPNLAALGALTRSAFPASRGVFAAEAMPGGASSRLYFRLRMASGTAVGMFVPDGSKPEEIANGSATTARWPFLEVRDLLSCRGIDVPEVYGEDMGAGWILLEDLGDDTLAAVLAAQPGRKEELYVRAVTDLAVAQRNLAHVPEGHVVGSRAFDEELLLWEIQHFREWALEARGTVLSSADRSTFDGIAERLARRIADWPRAFVHRDYQSRNLMVRPTGALSWIDFQDALRGPRVYDLVALLNDSYQVFDRAFVDARLDDYASAAALGAADRAKLGREFDIVTIQRKLKDAGRFVYIDRVKGNGAFLKFVAPTVAKVKTSLARLADDADMGALAALLARILPG